MKNNEQTDGASLLPGECGNCEQPKPIAYTTDDDVDLCAECYEALREEMTVRHLKPVSVPSSSSGQDRATVEQAKKAILNCANFYEHGLKHGQMIGLIDALIQAVRSHAHQGWQPIASAPRDSRRILVAYQSELVGWLVKEAWWRIPYEEAKPDEGYWQTMDGALLSADVHKAFKDGQPLGATHWQPLPSPPVGGRDD